VTGVAIKPFFPQLPKKARAIPKIPPRHCEMMIEIMNQKFLVNSPRTTYIAIVTAGLKWPPVILPRITIEANRMKGIVTARLVYIIPKRKNDVPKNSKKHTVFLRS